MAYDETEFADAWEKALVEGVKKQRLAQGMSQIDLAERMSALGFRFHQATIYKIENGERKVTAAEAMGFSQIFNVELDELWHSETIDAAEYARRTVWTVADRFTQSVLELDSAALRVREAHSALQYVIATLGHVADDVSKGTDGGVSLREFYAPLIAFSLHNELLWRLRQEVWANDEFQAAFMDSSGIVLLAPMDKEQATDG